MPPSIDASIAAKNEALTKAIADAQALIDDVNADPEQAQAAMDSVKQLQSDIEALKKLQAATPEQPAQDPAPEPDQPAAEAGSSDAPAADPQEDPEPAADPAPAASSDAPAEGDTSDAAAGEDNTDQGASDEKPAGSEEPADDKKKENRDMPIPVEGANKKHETRDALNAFLHSKGQDTEEIRAVTGVTSTDVGVTIPEDIIYNPENEVKTVADLGAMVTKTPVTSASGTYPILKRADAVMHTVEELAENPDLAKPEFIPVAWKVASYRGQIPISEESIADSAIDLTGLVQRHTQTIKVNTTNAAIAAKLAGFTAVAVDNSSAETLLDGLKEVLNVKLDPAYNKAIVLTQSLYHALDTAKDGEGRYLLQDQIGQASGKSFDGVGLAIVEDTAFGGEDGALQAFIGDLNRAILFANRADVSLEWVQYPIYGRILEPVMRFDVETADTNAGFFVTVGPKA